MTTIKLNKKQSDKPTARNSPVRRADPSKRDRSKPPPPRPTFKNAGEQSSRQRNHKHDGSLHESKGAPAEADGPISRSEF
ncbi:MAG: pseudouridine synthase, partial [Methylophilaceae bacterium]